MQFFRTIVLIYITLTSAVYAADVKGIIESREMGSCETNNLFYSAMKFYKIPLNEKYEDYDLYLRIILFFNLDGTLSLRTSTQALIGCQTSSSGEQACSYKPIADQWLKTHYELNNTISISNLGKIELRDETNTNRGFVLTFSDNYLYPHLRNQEFIGGMVAVNFDQNGVNTINICKN